MAAYRSKWGDDDPDVRRQLGLTYRYFGVFVEDRKWCRLLKHPFLSTAMLCLRVAIGVRFLLKR